ncbi:MAG: GNAT family N-acetyltransferase [Lachnospiraceae bacterium]|nr:GNAT family N-acetyltransferase [Lachnospiraceae bacterium]
MDHSFVRRAFSPEDQLGFQQCMAAAFVYSFNADDFTPRSPEELETASSETWVNGEGRVTSGYVVHDFDCWFDGQPVRTSGIGGVSSVPEGRSKGGIRGIFEKQLPDSYQKGYVFSILFPFSHVFYRKFGYELIQRTPVYEIPVDSLAPFADGTPARLICSGEEIQSIHEDFGQDCNLTIRRKKDQWHMVSKDPHKAVNFTYKVGEDAFVTFKKEDLPGGDSYLIKVRDMAYRTPKALRSLLGFFYTLRAQFGKVRLALPDSVPMMDMLAECYDTEPVTSAHGMARIVNVKKALELKQYKGTGSFTVKVYDAQIPENNGLFSVTYKDGAPTMVDKDAPSFSGDPDLEITVQRLSQLVLGSLTIRELMWLDGVSCSHPEKFEGSFTRKDIYFNDPF